MELTFQRESRGWANNLIYVESTVRNKQNDEKIEQGERAEMIEGGILGRQERPL